MSSKKGWVKVYRDITEHWVFTDPLLLKMWITLLCSANHEQRKALINKKLQVIDRGQFWTSIRKLALKTGMDKTTAKKKLDLLLHDGMIYVDSQPGIGTLITVRNYGLYQDFSEDDSDTESDRKSDRKSDNIQTGNRTGNRHKQELKNDKALIKNEKKKDGAAWTPKDDEYPEV